MSWSYRLVRRTYPIPGTETVEAIIGIHEAYADEQGRIWGVTKDPVAVAGETEAEVNEMLMMMAENALTMPVLNIEDIPEPGAINPADKVPSPNEPLFEPDEPPITSFTGEYRFLSNFAPALVVVGGAKYPTAEHAYQACKTHDAATRERIRLASSPGAAKRLGRRVPLRPDWEEKKVFFMQRVLFHKFAPRPMRDHLLATGNRELVEENDWGDTFWGVCDGEGQNELGRLLMEVRREYRRVTSGERRP